MNDQYSFPIVKVIQSYTELYTKICLNLLNNNSLNPKSYTKVILELFSIK